MAIGTGDPIVLGLDASRAGWVGIGLDTAGRFAGAWLADGVAELVERAGPVEVVAIDIPIGLPARGTRRCDAAARERLGRRAVSVFTTPTRAAVLAEDYPTAAAAQRNAGGTGLTMQAYRLRERILDVDRWRRRLSTGPRLVESHPELGFAALAGAALPAGKRTWAGLQRRRQLLAEVGVRLPDELGPTGRAGPDDVLDAAVVAWAALCVHRGDAEHVPDPPEEHDGFPTAIWWGRSPRQSIVSPPV